MLILYRPKLSEGNHYSTGGSHHEQVSYYSRRVVARSSPSGSANAAQREPTEPRAGRDDLPEPSICRSTSASRYAVAAIWGSRQP
jgi:hypothetical protein